MNAQIRRYLRTVFVVIILGLVFLLFIAVRNEKSDLAFTTVSSNKRSRGVIVTLIRSTNRSISLTINMIHSVIQFHPSNNNYPYPFLIFHDQNFTSTMRQYILSCVLKSNQQIQISFALINFHTQVEPDVNSRQDKPIGYRLMCRFWTYDVFYHSAIVQGQYDYLMRMDDDSYFFDGTNKDLFLFMENEKLDYMYRSSYGEPYKAMHSILQRFLGSTVLPRGCIYNNFFIIRLKWFYQSKLIQKFLRELIRNDLILREYIGDGCIHSAMLEIDKEVKVHHITDISYGHNIHLMPIDSEHYRLILVGGFSEEMLNSCQQLTVIDVTNRQLKKIKMSE